MGGTSKDAALGGSSSAPVLSNSPYAQTIGNPQKKPQRKAWAPPPGAFNHPDLPKFDGPGPGRYTPGHNLTKPRVAGTRFGSEDRFKYLGPQLPLEVVDLLVLGPLFVRLLRLIFGLRRFRNAAPSKGLLPRKLTGSYGRQKRKSETGNPKISRCSLLRISFQINGEKTGKTLFI